MMQRLENLMRRSESVATQAPLHLSFPERKVWVQREGSAMLESLAAWEKPAKPAPVVQEPYLVFSESKERMQSIGLAVLIVGLDPKMNGDNASDPKIWTIIEKVDKEQTNKLAGQISVPAETKKVDEGPEDNLWGALVEFVNDEAFDYVKRHLIRMEDISTREKGVFVRGKVIDVVVLIYDGALDFPFKPVCDNEVSPNGWVTRSELLKSEDLREPIRQALELDIREGLVRKNIQAYYDADPEGRVSVFPEGFVSMEDYYEHREGRSKDVHYGWKEIKQMLPVAHELTLRTLRFLADSQRSGTARDMNEEDRIIAEFDRIVDQMYCGDDAVGVDEVRALNMKAVSGMNGPIGGFKSWPEDHRKKKRRDAESHRVDYELMSLNETGIKSYGYWEIQRGDRLGYPELGTSWYMVVSKMSKDHSNETYAIIPVDQIMDLKLRPYDKYGM